MKNEATGGGRVSECNEYDGSDRWCDSSKETIQRKRYHGHPRDFERARPYLNLRSSSLSSISPALQWAPVWFFSPPFTLPLSIDFYRSSFFSFWTVCLEVTEGNELGQTVISWHMVTSRTWVHELPIRLILALMPNFHDSAFHISLRVMTEVTHTMTFTNDE